MTGFRTLDRASPPKLEELSLVSAVRDILSDGQVVPRGATGTIVLVYGDCAAYEVEFMEPFSRTRLRKPRRSRAAMSANCIVPDAKVRDYLLNPNHPYGASKARFFISLGFERSRHDLLADALAEHFDVHQIARSTPRPPWGSLLTVTGSLTTPSGKTPDVTSGWIRRSEASVPVLVTAYPT